MDSNDTTTTTTSPSSYHSLSPQSSPPPPPVVVSPCAACKILRRRCVEKCVLAPYFPPKEPLKFTTAHRVFGASNIIKMLQELPESQRDDAISSMVYEANARIRDPVYGSAGTVFQLHKQVNELQTQLAKAQAELVNMQFQQANLVALVCQEMSAHCPQPSSPESIDHLIHTPQGFQQNFGLLDDNNNNVSSAWEPLWT
ncbi:hypothetical protein IFM89_022884 [Coptis chinensis]|uniref:LOB domain-containing protein n=1 Tax=Coptis chinensis TaxID=261450 RepID=A0A835H7C6_9MAGN|nr:hypothetical protein IFM89_022884 [Coptis chinensis]